MQLLCTRAQSLFKAFSQARSFALYGPLPSLQLSTTNTFSQSSGTQFGKSITRKMATQRAIVVQGKKEAAVVSDHPIPEIRPGYVKVNVKAVALNPTDWKSIDRAGFKGHLAGVDFSGVVEETGSGYTTSWKVGDRIAGFAHGSNGSNKEDGTFAQHIVAKADVQLHIPQSMSFEDAATLGCGYATCGQGLYQELGLNLPDNPIQSPETIFIYGGSTATGALGIQYAKLSGYKVITTCGSRNFDYVKSLGADAVFDYKDPKCAQQINDYTGGNLKLVWDTISLEPSAKLCAEVISSGGHYATLLPIKAPREDVKSAVTLAYTVFGEPVDKGWFKKEDTTEDFEFMKKFASVTEKLLADGKLKVHKPKVGKGLDGVLEGLDLMRNDKVSGEKLVYTV